jgi:peptidoglycan/LPS O-acetylase OafA/YrhL
VTELRTVATPGPAPQRDRRHRPESPAGPRSRHRRDIEGLRAVAVLLVVAYHCGLPLVTGGYIGVDVFFVISGFLITGLLLRELRSTGTLSIPGFYARRALRLLPAATVVVVATVAAATWWLPPLRRDGIFLDALHTTFYGINYRLASIGTDYLGAEGDPSPLQHFWSLAVEEQFYLIWPPLLLAVAVGLRRRRAFDTTRVYAVLAAVVVGSFLLSVWQTGANASWAYFGAHTRAWELGIGALVAVAAGTLERLSRGTAVWLSVAGLAAIGGSAIAYSPATAFPGSAALLPVLGTAAVIAGGCAQPSRLLSGAALQGIGRLSYSWYLWHWPFLIIAPFALGSDPAWWLKVLIAAAAFVAAMLTYALVENPLRHLAALRERPWRGVIAGVAMSALSASLCLLITAVATHAERGSSYRAEALTPATFNANTLQQLIAASVDAPAVPANLTPKLARAGSDKPQLYRDGCSGDFNDPEVKTPCAYGDLTSPTTVVIFGDSHAGHWFPALEKIALARQWKLVVVIKSACSAADALIYIDALKRQFDECTQWRTAAWQRIRSLRPTMVIMASTAEGGEILHVTGDQDVAWTKAWTTSMDAVSGPGTKVYFINDTPWHGTVVPECLSAHLDDPQACARSRQDAILMPKRRQMVIAAAKARGVTIIDPLPWFCTTSACPVIIGNVLVYKDRHHISTVYSRLLAPLLSAELTP